MIKKNSDPHVTFADIWLSHTDKLWNKHWLKKVAEKVNWNKFRYRLEKLYSKDEGRPAWDPLALFRCLILAQWYGLSDLQLEEAIEFRIDFRKFVGLGFEEEAPDSTTFSVFRERILPIYDKLLKILNELLEEAGYQIKEVVAVDATLIEAYSKPKGDFAGDAEGSWRGFPAREITGKDGNKVLARRPALYGYKINMCASIKTGFISSFSICPAAEHESRHFKELLAPETEKVYADKGYFGCKKVLKFLSIKDKIHDKGFRGKPLTAQQIKRNKGISKYRIIVEGIFGTWKQWHDWHKTKYCGLVKNQLAVTIAAMSWNMKKLAFSSA